MRKLMITTAVGALAALSAFAVANGEEAAPVPAETATEESDGEGEEGGTTPPVPTPESMTQDALDELEGPKPEDAFGDATKPDLEVQREQAEREARERQERLEAERREQEMQERDHRERERERLEHEARERDRLERAQRERDPEPPGPSEPDREPDIPERDPDGEGSVGDHDGRGPNIMEPE